MMTDQKLLAGIVKSINDRVDEVSRQYNAMFNDDDGHAYGNPEWYNHHDYASGAWKAKHDALSQEFDFLCKLLENIHDVNLGR